MEPLLIAPISDPSRLSTSARTGLGARHLSNLSRRWASTLVASALLALASTAHAAPSADAQAKFDEGKRAYQAGDVTKARDAYRAAYAIEPRYDIAANLATTELALGDNPSAAAHFSAALRDLPADADAAKRAALESGLAKAAASLGAITATAPDGAEVLVDGEPAGVAPLPGTVYVTAARHELAARVDGRVGPKITLSPGPGSAMSVVLEAPAAEAPPPAAPPSAVAEAPPAPARSTLPIYVGAGLSVAAVGLGVGSIFVSNGYADNVIVERDAVRAARPGVADRSLCYAPPASIASTCADLQADASARDTWASVSVGALIGGGVLALGTVAYAIFWPSPPATEPAIAAIPVVSQDGGGVQVIGSF